MNFSLNGQQLGAWLLRLASLAAIATQMANSFNLPNSVRVAITTVSGIILAVDRYVTDPTTGTGPAPK